MGIFFESLFRFPLVHSLPEAIFLVNSIHFYVESGISRDDEHGDDGGDFICLVRQPGKLKSNDKDA